MNKSPLRQCISCRKQLSRNGFIRLMKVHDDSSRIIINPDKHLFGRSAYVCSSSDCIKSALKQKKIEKMLRISEKTAKETISKLEGYLNNICMGVPA